MTAMSPCACCTLIEDRERIGVEPVLGRSPGAAAVAAIVHQEQGVPGERGGERLDVAGDVFGIAAEVDECPVAGSRDVPDLDPARIIFQPEGLDPRVPTLGDGEVDLGALCRMDPGDQPQVGERGEGEQ